ncbi:MAG TPA: SurA N-terminal domain-containing protein [Hyphomicrobiaceae bacterium]|nr:SurA N-terminal domain-containing protein [Hyphomicrobiaceae bacterium]
MPSRLDYNRRVPSAAILSAGLCACALFLSGLFNPAPLAPTRAQAASSEHAIIVLVNDDPITAYEVEQRGRLLALSANIGDYIRANAKTRWEKIVKNPKINDEFRAYATKRNPQSREALQKIQQDFIKAKQKTMMEQLQREARAQAVRGTEKQAIKELIEERLKLQEAKRNNVVASDQEVDKIIAGIAERNKMTPDQFAKQMASSGVNIATMRQRFRASLSWSAVVRRRFGYQIAITERDVERFVDPALAGGNDDDGADNVRLKVQRVTLAVPSNLDQRVVAEKLAQADRLRRKFSSCKTTAKLASSIGAKFEDLGERQPASIAEPTRTLLLNAKSGEMIPPNVGPDGVELWAVCERKEVAADKGAPGVGGGSGKSAKEERRRKELDILARKHLKDLRQDATIDCRADAKSGLCRGL